MTIKDLFDIQHSITPATMYFNHGGIEKFRKKYGMIMRSANQRLSDLITEYVEFENGSPKTDKGKFIFKFGKSESEFNEKREKIFNQQV